MEKSEARRRAAKLREAVNHHRYLYHVLDKQEISDAALDSLKSELEAIETAYPDLVTPDSPTQRVGGEPLEAFTKVRHEVPMYSFFDASGREDMEAWKKRVENFLGQALNGPFYCELKIDGFAIELVYEDGVFMQGSTRGDGRVGEDVIQNLRTIEAIPLRLRPERGLPRHLVVRGEVFLTKDEFVRINEALAREGKDTYANPRNLAAGSIRQLDPKVLRVRKLDSFMYDIAVPGGFALHSEEHEALRRWGFKTNPHNKQVQTFEEVFSFWEEWNRKREDLAYEVDGVVVIIDDNRVYERAGVVGKGPRGAIAFKFTPQEATTKVRDVKVQVGRSGVLTPVAHLEPVKVAGVTISHATLHNFDEIERLGLKVGDTVVVSRAGDVIPKVTHVLIDLRTGAEKSVAVPKKCPIDGSPVVRDGVFYRCSSKRCGAVQRKYLAHFVSKPAFDIDGLGGKIIDRFIDEGLISDAADIFELERGDIAVLEGFGEKSADNIVNEVEKKKNISLERFLFALGVRRVGEETARDIAVYMENKGAVRRGEETPCGVFGVLKSFHRGDFEGMQNIGPEASNSLYAWLHDSKNEMLMRKFQDAGVKVVVAKRAKKTQKLAGKKFVLTGALRSISRAEAAERIRARGGGTSSAVSHNTDFVVVGADPGSKLAQARKLGIETLDEQSFLKLLGE